MEQSSLLPAPSSLQCPRPRIPASARLELVPLTNGQAGMFALRDPYGIAQTVALPEGAAVLVTLMNGQRTLGQLRQEFQRRVGQSLTLDDVRHVVEQLDTMYFLDNDRFATHEAALVAEYQALETRPAAHAGALTGSKQPHSASSWANYSLATTARGSCPGKARTATKTPHPRPAGYAGS